MVGVDAADFTKIILRRVGAKLIKTKIIRTIHDRKVFKRYSRRDSATPRTHRTITPPHVNQSVWEVEGQLNTAAMAGGFVGGYRCGLWGCGEIDYWA